MSSQQDQAGAEGSSGGPAAAGNSAAVGSPDSLPRPQAMPGPVPATGRGSVKPARPPGSSAPGGAARSGAARSGTARSSTAPGAPGLTRKKLVWKTRPDGTTVFRLGTPQVLWWVWIAFVLFNAVDLSVQSPDVFSLKVGLAILVVTGIIYACAFRPRVITDAVGLTVHNPFRDYRVPWGGIGGVYLGDSVEIQCPRPDPQRDKIIYSWALYSPRRTRAKAELRQGLGTRRERERRDSRSRRSFEAPDPASFGRLPAKAKELASQHPSHVMAGELTRRLEEARKNGAQGGVVSGRWVWLPIAAVLIPAIALAVLIAAT